MQGTSVVKKEGHGFCNSHWSALNIKPQSGRSTEVPRRASRIGRGLVSERKSERYLINPNFIRSVNRSTTAYNRLPPNGTWIEEPLSPDLPGRPSSLGSCLDCCLLRFVPSDLGCQAWSIYRLMFFVDNSQRRRSSIRPKRLNVLFSKNS